MQRFDSEGGFLQWWMMPLLPTGMRAEPTYLAIGDSRMYIAADGYVMKYNALPTAFDPLITEWPLQPTPSGSTPVATGIAVASDGNVFVGDSRNKNIQKFTPDGQFLLRWGSAGTGPGQFSSVMGLAADRAGHLFAVDANNRVEVFDLDGHFLYEWGSLGMEPGQFAGPSDVAVDQSGEVYVSDRTYLNDQLLLHVQKFSPDGTFLCQWSGPGSGPGMYWGAIGIDLDASGNLYLIDSDGSCVKKLGMPPVETVTVTWGRLKATYR